MNLRMPSALVALLVIGSLTVGLATAAMGAPGDENAYILGPGDTIDIVVIGVAELSRTVPIKPDGSVDLPLVGLVTAAGKTTSQLAAELVKRYSAYLKFPSITVAVHAFRDDRISILGQVNHPGEYALKSGVSILDLLAGAGGPTTRADLAKVTIIRGQTDPINLDLLQALAQSESPDVKLMPGDVVFVPEADHRMVILGQVKSPGAYDLVEGQRVSDLLAAAGGLTPEAAPQRTFITRGGEEIPVDAQAILAGNVQANVPLQSGDMVVVPKGQDQIAVLGAVNKTGKYDFVAGMNLIDAITSAGGQTPTGNLGQVGIIRLDGEKPKTITAHLDRALSGKDMSQNLTLQPGDIVYVPEKGVTLDKVFQIFSIAGVIRYLFAGGAFF
jgi:polysaccharide biosynthesis/export protein